MKERFKIVWDNGKQYLWDFGNENDTEVEVYSINEADDLLNILSKENEQLKSELEKLEKLAFNKGIIGYKVKE